MKLFQRAFSLFLLLLFVCLLAIPVMATANAEYQGLQVTVTMDKEQYEEGETITATITVVNTNTQPVTIVNLEQLIPEGYMLAEDSEVSTKDVVMQPGQTIELRVTFEGDPEHPNEGEDSSDFWHDLFYGETLGIPTIIIVVIAVIGFIIFMLLT